MSISTTATKDSYQGNNSIVTQYPITFKYFEESHISVYFDGVLQTKGAGADYVMGGDGTTSTGYITTNVAQAGTVTVAITLDVPFDQPVVLQETGSLPAKTIEVEGFDRLNMQVRRVWRKLQDVLTFNTDEAGASTGTADNLIGFDGSGDIAEIPNTTFLQTANNLSDVDAATARTNLGVDATGTDNSTDVTLLGTGTHASLVGQALTIDKVTAGDLNSESATVGQVLQADGDTTCSFIDLVGGGNAQTANPLSQFAATTSAQLAGVISDETGTGALVFATSPTLVTPALGIPTAIDLVNATNTPLPAAGTVTETMLNTSANLSLDKADGSVQITNNLSDVTASTARTNLGVAIGSDVQAHSSVLDDIVTLPSVTGTATFTNSTNNIALTGVGSLTGLAVGDVIEVTGSVSNNDVFTVETITDTGNVIVNAEHAGGTTSKSLTDETVAVTVTLVCKAKNAPLGYGQGWVTVTTGRSLSVVYNNITGRTISIQVIGNGSVAGANMDFFVGGNWISQAMAYNTSAGETVSGLVSDGSSYESRNATNMVLLRWSELR